MIPLIEILKELFIERGIEFIKYKPQANKPYYSTKNRGYSLDDISKVLMGSKRPSEAPLRDLAIAHSKGDQKPLESLLKQYFMDVCNIDLDKSGSEGEVVSDWVLKEREKLSNLVLAKDITMTRDRDLPFFCYNRDTGRISGVPAKHYQTIMGIKNPDLEAMPLLPIYDPRGPTGIYEKVIEDEVFNVINTYLPPKWRSLPCSNKYFSPPPEVEVVFRQNAAFEKDYDFLIYFIYQMLTSRPRVFLVLCGNPGVGKNVLKTIIKALVGFSNSVDGKKSTLTTRFNKQLKDAIYLHFDELSYSKEEENVMKLMPEKTMSVEEKGHDATRSTKIYAAMVISNNRERDNYIHFDSRKFAPLMMSDIRLEDALKVAFKISDEREVSSIIDTMVKKLDETEDTYDIEYVSWIGNYVLQHGAELERINKFPRGEYRGPKFWKLAHSSLANWQKFIISCLAEPKNFVSQQDLESFNKELEEGTLKYSRVQKEILKKSGRDGNVRRREFPAYNTGRDFLKEFADHQGKPVYGVSESIDSILNDFYISKLTPEQVNKKIEEKEREIEEQEAKAAAAAEEEDFGGL